jgi:hypothetical protein
LSGWFPARKPCRWRGLVGTLVLHVLSGVFWAGSTFAADQFYQRLYRPDLVREKLAGDPNGKVRDAEAKLHKLN